MASKVIGLFLLGMLHASADSDQVAKLEKIMSKAFAPAASMTRLGVTGGAHLPVGTEGSTVQSDASMHSDVSKTLADLDKQNQEMNLEYQNLRARIQQMPQVDNEASFDSAKIQQMPRADNQASLDSAAPFGWLVGLFASVGLAASVGVAAVRKHSAHGQHGSESSSGSQISRVPQQAGQIMASAAAAPARSGAISMKGDLVDAELARTTSVVGPTRSGAINMNAVEMVAPPPSGFAGAVAAGEKKANMPAKKIFGLGMLSGAHIGFGAYLMLSVGGASPGLAASNPGLQKMVLGAFGLPFGLMMTVLSGAELFTGNTALVTMAVLEGKVKFGQLIKSWGCSYAGNFIGSVLLAGLVFYGNTLSGGGASLAVSAAKTSLTFTQAFVRGILCNWLVCMAVYLATMARDTVGKMVPIWFCISAFVAMGLEHSVANMFIIPLGIFSGAAVSWSTFLLKNLLPVTLGNIFGGAVCVGVAFCAAFGKLGGNKD